MAGIPYRVFSWIGRGVVVVLGIVAMAILCADLFGYTSYDVTAPEQVDRQAAVTELARAAAVHGICYGWRLDDGRRRISEGSNLGDGVAVDVDSSACPRWVELVVTVKYTRETSDLPDSAKVRVVGSASLSGMLPTEAGLGRLGLTSKRFEDDPADSILRGAMALPLLLAERGAVGPVPFASGTAEDTTATAAPLPAASNDFWRDRLPMLLWAIGLLLLASIVAGSGWLSLRRNRRDAAAAAAAEAAEAARKPQLAQRGPSRRRPRARGGRK